MTSVVAPEDRWADQPGGVVDRAASPRARTIAALVRGRRDDPVWVRPALIGLLALTAAAYIWDLGASGWANSFYTAAVQAGTKSWKAMLFGSFDPANFITVDKSPAALWVMEISGRIFGFNTWSMLVPEALEGVASVWLVYLAVRRWSTPGAGLAAGLVVSLTPVAALMFRFNNPDALMVMMMALGVYATERAVEDGRYRWMVLAGSAVGFAFLAKMLEAFLLLPPLAAVVILAGKGTVWQRVKQLLVGGAALAVAGGWWVMAVTLIPAADRPYIGGSQDNSIWNLMFGYNGIGRLNGNETGSVGGGATGTGGRWGATGITRLFGSEMGTQISWLLPAALVLLVAGLAVTFRAPRTNRTRAGLVLWGGWLLVAGAAFSLGQGIIHPYYTVALAPPIGGLVGVGGTLMWANRDRWVARAVMSTVVAVTAVWSFSLLGRTPHWLPWLRGSVLVVGLAGAAGILAWPYVKRPLRAGAAGLALFGGLAAPLAYTLDTVRTPHSGAIPSAGPAGASSGGFGGGPGRGFPGGSRNGAFGGGFPGGNITGGGLPGGNSTGGGFPGANGNGGLPGANGNGTFPGGGANSNGAFPGGSATGGTFPGFGTGRQGGFGPGGAGGGLLDASRPSAAMVSLLDRNASKYTWVAASVGANSAAGYQLATGHAVMAIGGFNGTDPYPTLAEFEKLVSAGKVHYFIGGGGFGGGPGGGSASSSAISSWVESHFTASTVGGVTVYDLTAPSGT